MMLTKEECNKVLNLLRNVQIGESEDVEQANDVFEQLIEEHFKDKKSLEERFKDYKENHLKKIRGETDMQTNAQKKS